MSMNLVWLGIGGASLVAAHAILLLILRWRTGSAAPGLLSPPRFEIFLLIIALPSASQSSTFAINGSASGGVIVGSLVLAIPAAFILSVSLFLAVVISSGRFVQYKEIRYTDVTRSWRAKLSVLWVGGASNGRWFGSEKLPSSFFKRFGILFESRKGPPEYVFADDSSQARKWAESGPSGIGRMRAVSGADDSNEDRKVSLSKRLIGHAQAFYIILDLSRRAVLGALSAARKGHDGSVESAIALAFTAIQLVSLVIIRPNVRSGVHIAESISLLSEAAIFGISASAKRSSALDQKALGSVMLALLGLTFISHMTNEWYALINHVLRLSGPRNKSLKLGVKCAAKGLVLIFLPKRHWSSITPEPARPDTRPALAAPSRDPLSAMTATVVPTLSPGSPSPLLASDERPVRGLQLQPRSEIRKLRALAKASFSTDPREEDEPGNNNGNYPFTVQSSSNSSDDPRPSSPNVIKHN